MNGLGSSLRLMYWCFLLFAVSLVSNIAAAQMAISVASTNFGTVQVGSSMITPVTVRNGGKSTVTITQASTSGSGFSFVGPNLPISLSPRKSTTLSVSFAPQSAGTASGSLSVTYSATWNRKSTRSGSASGALSGTGSGGSGYLSVPSSLNFGNVTVGSNQSQALTVSNTGGASVTISATSISGSGYTVGGMTLPYSLAAGASANLTVTFAPTTSGTDSASLSITSNATDSPVSTSLTGSGTTTSGTLGVSPASMSFGNVTVGTTQSQNGSVTANGGSITLSSASSNNSAFSLSGLTLPVTLAAGQSAPFTVTFAPSAAGSASANISFFASNSTSASESATGTGATIQHSVDLSWNASTSDSVTGYNVYRATSATGSYTRVNPTLDSSLSYVDSSVQSGQTYYYATTAVDSSGVESSYSNQVQVVVPFP